MFLTIGFEVAALVSGIRKKYPHHLRFIGHTRFGNYFMITIFPRQSPYLPWTRDRPGDHCLCHSHLVAAALLPDAGRQPVTITPTFYR